MPDNKNKNQRQGQGQEKQQGGTKGSTKIEDEGTRQVSNDEPGTDVDEDKDEGKEEEEEEITQRNPRQGDRDRS